jgi:hypothetical protein
VDAGQLLAVLERALDNSSDDQLSTTPYSADALRKQLQTLPPELRQTGFPGLPRIMAESKARFEEGIVNISSLLA